MNYITEHVHPESKILWQENEIHGPDQPIVIESYENVISLVQGENVINIQYTAVKDLIKIIKDLKEPE